jgi:hypothetical protein
MKRPTFTIPFLLCFSMFCICMSALAQVEQLISYTVTDEATFVESFDEWFASDESDYGQTATLVTAIADGSNPATHYLVLNYPDFASYEAAIDGVAVSDDFAKLERRISGIMAANGDSIYLHRLDNGKSEKEGDFLYTVSFNIAGAESIFLAAQEEMINSELGEKAPGILKLVANRAGGDSSHLAIISAPSLAALNKFLDIHSGNKDWEEFQNKVGGIVASTGSSFLRVVKIWK